MSNIHNAGPGSESLDLPVDEEGSKNENADVEGPASVKDPTPMGNTDPTIKNH